LGLRGVPRSERSQRSRGFLFLELAIAAAMTGRARQVLVFENGYGALNPRLSERQVGAHTTKAAHPTSVARMHSAIAAAGLHIPIELPHLSETKADHIAQIPTLARDLIALTVSCDGFPLRKPAAKQCGECSSCVLRQQSLVASGLEAYDRKDYLRSVFRGDEVGRPEALLMSYQAWMCHSLSDEMFASDALMLWPELRPSTVRQPDFGLVDSLRLLRRWGAEWYEMTRINPSLGRRLQWPNTVLTSAA
jgi:hypothetical protein